LELIRSFGETIPGKLTVRNSIGSSSTFDDFGIRFVGLKDGLGLPSNRSSLEQGSRLSRDRNDGIHGPRLVWSRTGGEISHIEDVVDKHLSWAEHQAGGLLPDLPDLRRDSRDGVEVSPFYSLYLRRLLSGIPLTPHETFAHPVACVVAISSRNPTPLEELRRLYSSTNTGDHRLPQWVNNEFLRYYVLVHDEENDDIKKSTALFDQMKRHYGLNCHLLRIRSTQAIPSDDDSYRLPLCDWISASEELYEIRRRGKSPQSCPYLFSMVL
jgi:trafficking protein particle complex subunit 8